MAGKPAQQDDRQARLDRRAFAFYARAALRREHEAERRAVRCNTRGIK